ncbi:P-loop containing nucleoside triphosphate hydrolase [Vibrio phage 2.275.O._10N.286.54.E11]|nr:P-loop containing nucleoside triphosphate hydrolase [Vibrio phage 2.275.O._10N.286.54.E11]
MVRPFDPTKFRKQVNKSVKGMSMGFNDPDTWLSTGSYALNYRISGQFEAGVPLGKVTVFAGESGAGKSYIVSGNVIKDAQDKGVYCFVIDSENALDEKWLHNLGVDTSEDKMTKLNMAMIDDVAKTISEFVQYYKGEYAETPKEERPKVLWVIDSLGMLLTPTEVNQFEDGNMKGDMGRKAKQLKALVMNCTNMFGDLNIGLVATNHTYASQDMFNPDPVVAGGAGFVYASSIMVAMQKLKLKEDEDGNKVKEVSGIRAKCKVMKSRYNKPFEDCELKIPWDGGMNPYSGLVDMFEKAGLLTKQGNRLRYEDTETGEEILMFRKPWNKNENGCLDLIMKQFHTHPLITPILEEELSDEDDAMIDDDLLDVLAQQDIADQE